MRAVKNYDISKAILHTLSHEVNNVLQNAICRIEQSASIAENNSKLTIKEVNALVFGLTKNIYAIRDLCFGYSNLLELPLAKHLELVESIYGRKIQVTGDIQNLPQSLKHLVAIYTYVFGKNNNVKIFVDNEKIVLSPHKNAAHLLPNSQTHLGKIINAFTDQVEITASEDSIFLTKHKGNNKPREDCVE